MTPPVSPSPRLPVSPKIVKKHVTNDELTKGGARKASVASIYEIGISKGGARKVVGWALPRSLSAQEFKPYS